MYQYQITKYDPKYRDECGAYTKQDWISNSDIGKTIGGSLLTEQEYYRVEKAYTDSALNFLNEANITSMTIRGLENHRGYPTAISDGMKLPLKELVLPFREVLREEYWCRFECADETFVHFGYDYYMYIGTRLHCGAAIQFANKRGLFVEEFVSPYHPEGDE